MTAAKKTQRPLGHHSLHDLWIDLIRLRNSEDSAINHSLLLHQQNSNDARQAKECEANYLH